MNSSFLRGLFLSLLLVVAGFTIFSLNEIDAQQNVVTSKSVGLDETTIIEFENKGSTEIKTFRIWLGADNSFKSFKTEKGWTGEKTPQGVIIFTSADPIKPGQSVKFGVKTDKVKPGINWKAVDKNANELQIGKTLVSESPSKPATKNGQPSQSTTAGVLTDSKFRLIPEKPNVGGTVRVTGDQFSSNQKFDLYMNDKFMKSFETDENGHFMLTTKIPEGKADRVNFVVKDKQGNEKAISIRLGGEEARKAEQEVKLTVLGLPSTINPGDVLLISGTGTPGGTITAEIKSPTGQTITSEAAAVSPQGDWSFKTIVALDADFGKYSAEISDGKEKILKTWTVESSKTIQVVPAKIVFEPGEPLQFNGTGLPNERVDIILKDPTGNEIYSDIIQPRSDGFFSIDFPTQISSLEGTYALVAFQGDNSEIILVGLGELPQVQLVAQMDKINYKAGQTAIISLIAPPSSTISLLIVDPSDKPKFSDTIIVGPDGKKDYELDLAGYGSGVYTTVISRGNAQDEAQFSVGLQTGSGVVNVGTTKLEYMPGDPLLILGNSGSNILITLTMYDPDGNVVKIRETFTNKKGTFSEGSFRIPADAKIGAWKIRAESGPNFSETEFQVLTSEETGMVVFVDKIQTMPTVGKIVNIRVIGGAQNVFIDIFNSDGELIDGLTFPASAQGELNMPWPVPKNTPPGVYTIKVHDPFNQAETTFTLE